MAGGGSGFWGTDQPRSTVFPTQLGQYSVALLSVALALGVTILLDAYLRPTPTPLFFIAVMVSAWYGGLGPGLLATFLATLTINYFLLDPVFTWGIPDVGTAVRLGVFMVAALLINSLNEAQLTARRRAEANFRSLHASEARFGCLVQSNIIGMIVADLDGAILDANHNFLQLVGYTEAELRAGRLHWRQMTSPESLEVSERAVQELLTTGACTPFEKEYRRQDGSRVVVVQGAVMTGERTVTGFVLDLSERKQLEAIQTAALRREQSLRAEVQAAHAQLEMVLASLNDQFLMLDREWRYIYVSDRVVETVGKPREALLGKCIWEIFPETVGNQFYQEVHRAVRDQEIVQFEYFYSPWQCWFENRVYPAATGVSILVTDITGRKQAEIKLQRTNQALQTLLDACPVAIVFFNPEGIVQLWNRAAEGIFGWRAEEAIGQFMPTVAHRSQEFLANLQMVLSGQSLDGFEAQHQRQDGQMVELEIWANLTPDAEGNPGCLCIAWDITDRKRAEADLRQSQARFQVLVSNMPGMVYRYAPDTGGATTFTYVSSGSWELVELTPEAILQDANSFFALIHPDDLPSFQCSVAIAVKNSAVWQWEGRLITPSGQRKWVQGRSRPERTESGEVWDGLFIDITDRKQAETEREQLLAREKVAREEAETANRIKDEFLAVLSHELRSPLNPILGWAKILQTQKLDEQKTQQALTTIERNAKLQTQLIEDLLDVSRILRGKLLLNIAPVSLINTIEAALETVRLAVEAKEITVQKTFNLAPDQVMGDVARLQQVVWNLLTNAVKFTPPGGTVEIRLERVNHSAQIQVKDTGKGINPEFLPYVFDYFRQEDGTTTRKFGGLGLGLAIVRHTIELHGGTVGVESPGEGCGATFTVQLPLMPSSISNVQPQATPPHASLSGLRVLAVDDDADIRALIAFILQEAGAEVRVAASATEALQQLETFSPELLVSDIGLPEFDGYMLMQQIRTLLPGKPEMPAIALTAYAGETNQQQAIAAGFQLHLAKPVEPEKLINAIIKLLGKSNGEAL